MIWNTIAHPKMMTSGDGASPTPGPTLPDEIITFSPIKFADPHKLSFYDIIVTRTDTTDDMHLILVRGDFETIKKMLLNGEAVCGAIFTSEHSGNGNAQDKTEIKRFVYDSVLNCIGLYPVFGELLYLLNDNTITMDSPTSGSGQPAGNLTPSDGSDQSELMP